MAYLLTLLLLFGMVDVVEATMIDNVNNKLVLDDITGKIWYRDVASFTNQTYSEQLGSISSLNRYYDINGDGSTDTLTWSIASHSDVLGLVTNYQLDNKINRADIMSHFSITMRNDLGNYGVDYTIEGRFGTDVTYGGFELNQMHRFWPTSSSPDYVHDPYGYGETNVSGLSVLHPVIQIRSSWTGAWATADVEYGAVIPEPSTIALLGIGIAGLAGGVAIRKRKKQSY